MATAKSSDQELGGIELCELAIGLLLVTPLPVWCRYLAGLCPFGLASLYYLADMSASPYAKQQLVGFSFLVTLTIVWWRHCQSAFGSALCDVLADRNPPPLLTTSALRLGFRQTTIFALVAVAFPLASLLLFPLGWLLAFGQSASIVGGSGDLSLRQTFQAAAKEVFVWQGQSHVALLVMSALVTVIFINLYLLVFAIPFLIKVFTGVESATTQAVVTALNSTVFIVICFATYALSSPLLKAIFALRHFHLQSRESGIDLRHRLRRIQHTSTRMIALTGIIALALNSPVRAQEPIANEAIDIALQEVLSQPEYAWRLPRDSSAADDRSPISRFVQRAIRWLERGFEWFFDQLSPQSGSNRSESTLQVPNISRPLLVLLILVIVLLVVRLIFQIIRRSREPAALASSPSDSSVRPDVDAPTTLGTELPEDEWLEMANDFLNQGDYRRALRAYYLSALAHLHAVNLIHITRSKANATYVEEVNRHAHQLPELALAFRNATQGFDRAWYGHHPVDSPSLAGYEQSIRHIRTLTQA